MANVSKFEDALRNRNGAGIEIYLLTLIVQKWSCT
jgi:hypothetical protein